MVNATDLARDLRTENNRVRAQLLAFVEVGLLDHLPTTGGPGKHWFRRRTSLFWEACAELVAAWEGEPAAEPGESGMEGLE